MNENGNVLHCEQVSRTFRDAGRSIAVLDHVGLTVAQGEQVAVVGRSGAGKSTLLHVLGGLGPADSGEIWVDGECMSALNNVRRGRLRNRALGFIYQFHHLLPEFTAVENVAMPLLIRGDRSASARRMAIELLERVGLEPRLGHKPGELSGGERQRVAIARALVTRPRCILADEPTGNLDSHTAETVFELFRELNRQEGTGVVLVTHDMSLAARLDRKLTLSDGRLGEEA